MSQQTQPREWKREVYETVVCVQCGETDVASYMEPTRRRMVDNSWCFTCQYWEDVLTNPFSVVADGIHYTIGSEDSGPRQFRGHGGARFVFRPLPLNNETRTQMPDIESTNVWYQGPIPERFRSRPGGRDSYTLVTINGRVPYKADKTENNKDKDEKEKDEVFQDEG